jgi:hypothetical protein
MTCLDSLGDKKNNERLFFKRINNICVIVIKRHGHNFEQAFYVGKGTCSGRQRRMRYTTILKACYHIVDSKIGLFKRV